MKKILLVVAVSLLSQAHAGLSTSKRGLPPVSNIFNMYETAAEQAGAATEKDGIRIDGIFTGVGTNVLASALRVELAYDISGSTAIGTQHGGAIFAETNSARNNQYFSFGLEDSIKAFVGALAQATAAVISHISHVKIWNDQNITQVFPAIAWNPRMDFFNGSNENVAFSTHTFGYFIRPEFYRLNQQDVKTVFGWYSPTDRSIQNVNAGNVFKVSISTQVPGGGTLDLSQACGGKIIITSTASITFSATQFANTIGTVAPSSSTLSVPYLNDCEVDIVNGNLNGRTLTVADTSDYTPISAGSEVIAASGGQIHVWAFGSAAQWVEGQAHTK
jgi:hypothetical protein